MRKLLIAVGFAFFISPSNAQPFISQSNRVALSSPNLNFAESVLTKSSGLQLKDPNVDYLKKSKKQKTLAFVLLGAGAGLITASFIIPKGKLVQEGIVPGSDDWLLGDEYKNDGIKGALGLAGVVSGLGSIPFFIIAHKNHKRALKASAILKVEQLPALARVNPVKGCPAIGLRISIF